MGDPVIKHWTYDGDHADLSCYLEGDLQPHYDGGRIILDEYAGYCEWDPSHLTETEGCGGWQKGAMTHGGYWVDNATKVGIAATRRRLSRPTDRRSCDSPVLLRLLDQIRECSDTAD